MKTCSISTPVGGVKWPLTGGMPSQLFTAKDKRIERMYVAGYSDGSVRIWDATFPVLNFLLEGQVIILNMSFMLSIELLLAHL